MALNQFVFHEKKKESKLIRIGTRSLKDDDGEPVSVFTIVVL